MSEREKGHGNSRRTFLFGLLTGAGVAAAVGTVVSPKRSRPQGPAAASPAKGVEPILYARTAEAERYYKTL